MFTKKFFKQLGVFGASSFGILVVIWSVTEVLDYFGQQPFGDSEFRNKYGIYILLLILFAIVIGAYLQQRFFGQPDDYKAIWARIKAKKQEKNGLINRVRAEQNYYKLLLIDWRLEIENKKYTQITSGRWTLEAHQPPSYLRYVLSEVVKILGPEDEYITLSNLDFWSKKSFGDSQFLDLNLNAIERGVKIYRIILFDGKIMQEPNKYPDQLRTIKEVITEFLEKKKIERDKMSQMDLSFYPSSDYKQDSKAPVPYALVNNKEKKAYMTILPLLPSNETRVLPKINIHFLASDKMREYQDHFIRFRKIQKKNTKMTLEELSVKLEQISNAE